jgi:hypothetical protein
MLDGGLAVAPATTDQDAFVKEFAGCLGTSTAPSG